MNETITKIAQKAIDNGWVLPKGLDEVDISLEYLVEYWTPDLWMFDHDFLKAYFGEEQSLGRMPEWMHKAQQLALADDRIEYLAQFL